VEISKDKIKAFFRNGREKHRRRTQRVLAALPYVLLAAGIGLCIFSGIRIFQIKDSQKPQIAAEHWSGDSGKSYRQVTCFAKGQTQADGSPDVYLSPSVSLNTLDIENIRKNLNAVVLAAAGKKDKTNPDSEAAAQIGDARLWIDAYSAAATGTVVRKATAVKPEASAEVTLTGVSGDYFFFHPMKLIDGAYLSVDTPDPKKIVLDRELAFKLFGTYKVTGSVVSINQREYTIVGVVQQGDSKIDRATSGDLVHAFILFDELAYLSSVKNPGGMTTDGTSSPGTVQTTTAGTYDTGLPGTDEPDPSTLAISSYEVVLPNKIGGIAEQNLKNAMETAGKAEKNFLFVDNTGRFSLLRLYDIVFPIGETARERQQYSFPFWEMSAQTAESVSVFWWIIGMTGILAALTSGLAIYAGKHQRKVFRV